MCIFKFHLYSHISTFCFFYHQILTQSCVGYEPMCRQTQNMGQNDTNWMIRTWINEYHKANPEAPQDPCRMQGNTAPQQPIRFHMQGNTVTQQPIIFHNSKVILLTNNQ